MVPHPPLKRETAAERSARRKERYTYLRNLGFSAKDARKYRDQTGLKIERKVNRERNRIIKKRSTQRTQEEHERLDKIIEFQKRVPRHTRERRNKSRAERYNDFSHWSSRYVGFPGFAIERIVMYNRQAGLSRDDAYGYRRFYFWYVERIADFENEFYADRNDSGLRHARGESLRARTPSRNQFQRKRSA